MDKHRRLVCYDTLNNWLKKQLEATKKDLKEEKEEHGEDSKECSHILGVLEAYDTALEYARFHCPSEIQDKETKELI